MEKIVDTTDEWIRTRTGIEQRHIAAKNQNTSDLAAKAAQKALDKANIKAEDVDYLLLATVTGDMGFPSTACYVQEKINAVNATAMDISAACTGFIYGLELADALIVSGKAKTVLVIGVEVLSRIIDYEDRTTSVLFGDGAGALILGKNEDIDEDCIIASDLGSDGAY